MSELLTEAPSPDIRKLQEIELKFASILREFNHLGKRPEQKSQSRAQDPQPGYLSKITALLVALDALEKELDDETLGSTSEAMEQRSQLQKKILGLNFKMYRAKTNHIEKTCTAELSTIKQRSLDLFIQSKTLLETYEKAIAANEITDAIKSNIEAAQKRFHQFILKIKELPSNQGSLALEELAKNTRQEVESHLISSKDFFNYLQKEETRLVEITLDRLSSTAIKIDSIWQNFLETSAKDENYEKYFLNLFLELKKQKENFFEERQSLLQEYGPDTIIRFRVDNLTNAIIPIFATLERRINLFINQRNDFLNRTKAQMLKSHETAIGTFKKLSCKNLAQLNPVETAKLTTEFIQAAMQFNQGLKHLASNHYTCSVYFPKYAPAMTQWQKDIFQQCDRQLAAYKKTLLSINEQITKLSPANLLGRLSFVERALMVIEASQSLKHYVTMPKQDLAVWQANVQEIAKLGVALKTAILDRCRSSPAPSPPSVIATASSFFQIQSSPKTEDSPQHDQDSCGLI